MSFPQAHADLKGFLEEKFNFYNNPDFITLDPISIPHAYKQSQDIEIAGFIAAILAWGQRKTIISKCEEFLMLMDNAPHDFVLNHQEADLLPFVNFKHRTFNGEDALYFLSFFKDFYQQHDSLEYAFLSGANDDMTTMLSKFHERFFALDYAPQRSRKHIATPKRKSACKRLNMYLRWMVRNDNRGVDFGLWRQIKPSALICPCDLHVDRVGRKLGLITRKNTDWQTALELTGRLKSFDPLDPVKYDFALFGLGVEAKL